MIDKKHYNCVKCKLLSPSYNFENESKPIYCFNCKLKGMINVKTNKCIICNEIGSSFNFPSETKATHCKKCSEEGMIDILSKNKKCIICKDTIAYFNFISEINATHCKNCSEEGMVDIKSSKCIECNENLPYYNYINEKKPTHCNKCRKIGMVDIKNRRCISINCPHYAFYNVPGKISDFCSKHKKDEMIKYPRKICIEKNCKEIAIYGIIIQKHCETHKEDDEYNLVERLCSKCSKCDILNKDGICINFCSYEEKDMKMKKNIKKKELIIEKLLKNYILLDIAYRDEIIDSFCSLSKPDFVYDCGTHYIIIEVDEFQHKSYTNCGTTKEEKIKSENIRMFRIFQSFNGIPCIFIRYNPDNFKINNKQINISDNTRHSILLKWINYCINTVPENFIPKVLYLFYDEYDESNNKFTNITEKDVLSF